MKRRKIKHKIPLYHGDLIIIQDNDLKWVEKKYNLSDLSGMGACAFPYPKKDGYTRYIMAFSGKTEPSIIAHEATHIVNNIYHDRNIPPDVLSDEPQAYLMGWVVKMCHEFLKIRK
jgi:hypothetical protein